MRFGDDSPQPSSSANSKAELKEMLRQAVLNTGGVPINGVVLGPPPPAPKPAFAARLEPQKPRAADVSPAAPKSLNTRATAAPPPASVDRIKRDGHFGSNPKVSDEVGEKIDMPTADEVARAIVAAARETGDDPIAITEGYTAKRGRHYAMHALKEVFPGLPRETLARLVGCPAKPIYFWNNSLNQVAHIFTEAERATLKTIKAPDRTRAAKWWDEAAFDRVIRAIRP